MRSVTVRWTATGDDGDQGTAAGYEINIQCGAELCPVGGAEFEPRAAGEQEFFTLGELQPGTDYEVLVQAFDEVGNFSNQLSFQARTLDANGWNFERIYEEGDGYAATTLTFGSDAQPLVGLQNGGFAERVSGAWAVEPNLPQALGMEAPFEATDPPTLRLAPSGDPAVLVRAVEFEGTQSQRLLFAERTDTGWGVLEEVAGGSFEEGGITGNIGGLAYVDGVAHVAYVGVESFSEEAQRYELLVTRRNGPNDWAAPEQVLSCPNPNFNNFIGTWGDLFAFALPADPAGGLPERLAIVSEARAPDNRGVLVQVSDGVGGWQIGHTGPLPSTGLFPGFFSLGVNGRIGFAFIENAGETARVGVVFIDLEALEPLGPDCELPATLNQFVEWLPEEQIGGNGPSALWTDGDELHLLGAPELGFEVPVAEMRLHSRCNGAWSFESLDATDGAPFLGPLVGPDGGMAIAYGTSLGYYYATREATTCN
jgi:hypothetical protein